MVQNVNMSIKSGGFEHEGGGLYYMLYEHKKQ